MTRNRRWPAALALLATLAACATTSGEGTLYMEPSIPRGSVRIHRVAVVPNRLPANLQDPEKWRRSNWEVIEREFKDRGYEVVDYDTSVKSFERSGLPVEDTKSSRDKYAELAEALGVDAIVVPYYGTSAFSKGGVLTNEFHFVAVATLQVYLTERNDFASRIDASGDSGYKTGLLLVAGIGCYALSFAAQTCSTFPGTSVQSCVPNSGLQLAGLASMLAELVVSGVMAARGADSYWENAFEAALGEGLAPFFAAYSPGVPASRGASAPPAPVRPFVAPAPPPPPTVRPAPQSSPPPSPPPSPIIAMPGSPIVPMPGSPIVPMPVTLAALPTPAASLADAQADARFFPGEVAGEAHAKVKSVGSAFAYFAIAQNGCGAAPRFVDAELTAPFDGFAARTTVTLRLEDASAAAPGRTIAAGGLRRAGKARDGKFVYCGKSAR